LTSKQENNRNSDGTFKKGFSGNVGGRPKGITSIIRELSNDYEDYLIMLDQWARDTNLPLKERIACANALLDRGVGKPSQHIQTEDVTPEPIEYVKEEKSTIPIVDM
jgi:hypothetical protein